MKRPPPLLLIPASRLRRLACLLAGIAMLLQLAPASRGQVINCVKIECPADLVVECTGAPGTIVNFSVAATTGCGRIESLVSKPASGSAFPLGETIVRTVAMDSRGNTAECSFKVIVRDTTAPEIFIVDRITVPCSDSTGANVAYAVRTADDCSPVRLECTPSSGSRFAVGTNIVSCQATDGSGNKATRTFEVVVTDQCADCIEITCPREPLVLEAGAAGTAVANYTLAATNHCSHQPVELQYDPPIGTDLPIGLIHVTATARSDAAVLYRCAFDVQVKDVTAPVIKAPRSITLLCDGREASGAIYAELYLPVSAKDNADPTPTLTMDPPEGSVLHSGEHDVVVTSSDGFGNTATRTVKVTVTTGPDCLLDSSPPKLEVDYNWDFEQGLRNWTAGGSAFKHQPTWGDNVTVDRVPELAQQLSTQVGGDSWRKLLYPVGHRGDHWVGTAENHPDDKTSPGTGGAELAVGNLVSAMFQLRPEGRIVTFLIGGQKDAQNLRVELLVKTPGNTPSDVQLEDGWYRVAYHATGHGEERMRREAFVAIPEIGERCRIRILDNSATGHLNVDDFRFQVNHPIFTKVTVAGREMDSVVLHKGQFYDWDSPVWGLADLHTHPMSHLGLGQKVFHGKPDGDIATALSDCGCDHGGWGTDNGCGNYLRQMLLMAFDGESTSEPHRFGWHDNPTVRFQRWPLFSSFSHQQMWHEWIRRAYDGGLRVMVALTVNGEVIAKAMHESIQPYDDRSVMESQLREMRKFVERHSDYMEIAYDPFELRRIIRENKLAIILGSETDQLGNFHRNPAVKEEADAASRKIVKDEISRLYHEFGLRYVFPVHLTDNKFGGSAVYNAMFTIATKDYRGRALDVEGVNDGINFRLPNLDALSLLPTSEQIGGAILKMIEDPFAPFRLFLETQGALMGSSQGFSESSMGLAAVGAVATVPLILGSPAAVPLLPLIPEAVADISSLPISTDLYPIGGNYTNYPEVGKGYTGHRNSRGLTKLGEYAVGEMMKLGMIIDIDHMAYHGITNLVAKAVKVPGGYPLNSGHNSFRALRYETSENNRTPEQLEQIRELGGLMGLGWGNSDMRHVSEGLGHLPTQTTSHVDNNCPGSSRTFAQSALYAMEFMKRRQVALGSDINGYVVGPGPRFGPQSAFGLREEAAQARPQFIGQQENGIAYSPREGRPGATGVFNGKSVDQGTENGVPSITHGFRYNKQQRDFFVALRIFLWGEQRNPHPTTDEYFTIAANMHPTYNLRRIQDLLIGLVLGKTDGTPGKDILDGDVEARQKIGKAVYRHKVLKEPVPDEFLHNQSLHDRWLQNLKVWADYEKIYGENTPMIRCSTTGVQWDYNFDGLAHYGLLPDFFQDLSNVEFEANDMSPLFQSAEAFAQMWTRCLEGSFNLLHPQVRARSRSGLGVIEIEWTGDDTDEVEESDDANDPGSWRRSQADIQFVDGRRFARIPATDGPSARFFRVRKVAE